ncbi:FIG00638518: hypothetical protein [Klebsiella pneumoniae IS53]|nr:FIG00638518: hypothetical protein [Klebsiella pneumoniae IS53]
MAHFFQRLFAKKSTPTPVRGPLGLHLKAGFTLDTLAFRLLEDNLLIELPGEAYTIAATGQIDLGGGSRIYRYYTSGDEFLQINTTGGADVDDIDDIKLFVYVQSDGISQEKYWRSAISPASIGTPTFSWRQQRWQRFFLTAASQGTLRQFICWRKSKISSMPYGRFIILRWAISGR